MYKIIGRRIKIHRNKLGLTQAKLAEKLDVSAKYISSIERGEANVSLKQLNKIANLLNIDLASLLSDCDSSSLNSPLTEISILTEDWTDKQKDLLISLVDFLNKFKEK